MNKEQELEQEIKNLRSQPLRQTVDEPDSLEEIGDQLAAINGSVHRLGSIIQWLIVVIIIMVIFAVYIWVNYKDRLVV